MASIPTRTKSVAKPETHGRQAGPWGQERRLEFIDFRLQWEGRINRADLIGRFGISTPQASADIARYTETAPWNLVYDRSERVYVAGPQFSSVFPSSGAEQFLNDVLARASGLLPPETSYMGWAPPVALIGAPSRAVPAAVLVAFVRAMRTGRMVEVLYQSMSRPEPAWRGISPHGIGHDGFRWHVRAFCHSRKAFRDFVFARVLETRPGDASDVNPADDEAWTSTVQLILAPNPGLSASKRKVVELDYAMSDGHAVVQTRQAMLYYTLQRLGLSRDGELRPEAQQIVLKNADEVKVIVARLARGYD